MIEDTELLGQFRETRSEEAFSEIVRRYIRLVYSVAYRQEEADDQRARDVCQEVFVALARKSDRLSDAVLLSGWLYRTARFTGRDAMRSERRRRVREQPQARDRRPRAIRVGRRVGHGELPQVRSQS